MTTTSPDSPTPCASVNPRHHSAMTIHAAARQVNEYFPACLNFDTRAALLALAGVSGISRK
ncbi:hypothetical protein [Diaphorobacter ruginosibacter]|uniref:hypothetical protein n=1 Tax=Diaphorobacter ruginosibacter TaxID=1715720 RepID=UPI00333E2865